MKGRDAPDRAYGEGWVYVSYGITFAVAIALFAFGGVWLDRRFGTMPLWTIVLTIVGMGYSGFWLINRLTGGKAPKS